MKRLIIDALHQGKRVMFKFSKDNTFTATVLINSLDGESDYIYVGQRNIENNRIINLANTTSILITD